MKGLRYVVGAGVTIGAGAVLLRLLTSDVHTFKEDVPPDVSPPPPGKTGHKLVDALLPKLRDLASRNNIPLGLIVGWIIKESGGKLTDTTSTDERGYFQISPDESAKLGIDHQRLSTDSDYSLDAGARLIHEYETTVAGLKVAAADGYSAFYWLLVKLCHTVGTGQTKKWVEAAQVAGAAGSWADFEAYVLGKSWRGPQPKKWFPFMDSLYTIGKPFGFGNASSAGPAVAGLPANEMRARRRESGTWGRPGRFSGGRSPVKRGGLLGLDVFAS